MLKFPHVPPSAPSSAKTELRCKLEKLSAAAIRATRKMEESTDLHMRESQKRILAEINAQIDKQVFALYGLSVAERGIIAS